MCFLRARLTFLGLKHGAAQSSAEELVTLTEDTTSYLNA